MKYFIFAFFTITYWLSATVSPKETSSSINGGESRKAEELFKRLYQLERAEQTSAIKALLKIKQEEKQRQMVEAIAEKVFSVIAKSRTILENSGYIPGITKFPDDEKVRSALANVMENTAFFGDVVMRLPEIAENLLKSHSEWTYLLGWSLSFTNHTRLLDKQTYTLISLVSQEMNFTERQANFSNPFRKLNKGSGKSTATADKKIKKIKKILPRGPRMSSPAFGDL